MNVRFCVATTINSSKPVAAAGTVSYIEFFFCVQQADELLIVWAEPPDRAR